ncbi:hypothetical protein ACS765_16600 [Yersinia enterocolitica]|uniref:hypothetical protein n=1 Tax=Yersinia enterocolitica TaxID=630 RepID=UPI001C60B49F|nr:hypothetical protein [Yersinia enterocolitica]ELW8952134.1 hypothetical protein [Yersinia enterocolitica]MBW5877766.1 hypothetical protein [Yersinia enterocolitica]HDL7180191.1 hypothetical protein [Yersinia enterocolitica]HEI6706362.1 hypothetical protein [Yersinia enterocolitica]HEN3324770.1 hypothetical protein [Yersinia enterocolitica]
MHNDDIKNALVCLASFNAGAEKDKHYNTDKHLNISTLTTDIFIASLLSELSDQSADKVFTNINMLIEMGTTNVDMSMPNQAVYAKGRAQSIISLVRAMKSSDQSRDV